MDFSVTDEQQMLVDSVSRFIDNDYDFDTRMRIAEAEAPFDAELWSTYAELGWTAILFPEADGGLDGGPIEMVLMMEQFGRGLVVEPFLANVILAGGIMKRVATADQRASWLSPLIEGTSQFALAFAEPHARYDIADIRTTAEENGGTFVVNGGKTAVLNGASADVLIVPVRTSGDATDAAGITLLAIPAQSEGVKIQGYKTVDGHGAAEVELSNVSVPATNVLGNVGEGYAPLRRTLDDATLAVCAEATGIQRTMHEKTVEYSKSRVQFGVPIGSFQALQHRMVDTLMLCEQTKSLLLWATMLAAENDAASSKATSALKYQIGTAGRKIAQEAVQIHGGMGVTWELDIAHYFKRHSVIELLFGDADYHLDRFVSS